MCQRGCHFYFDDTLMCTMGSLSKFAINSRPFGNFPPYVTAYTLKSLFLKVLHNIITVGIPAYVRHTVNYNNMCLVRKYVIKTAECQSVPDNLLGVYSASSVA